MSSSQITITILTVVFGTMLTRFLPFLVFNNRRQVPPFITYIGNYLPSAVMALLVVYAFRTSLTLTDRHLIQSCLAALITILVHLWRRSMLLSIAIGTFSYMVFLHLL